jgi:cell wall-associated NlpC family hydrolase
MTIHSTIHPGDRLVLPGSRRSTPNAAPRSAAPASPAAPRQDTTVSGASKSRFNLTATQRSKIVSVSKAQVGKRYVSGDEGPNTFDCSGLVNFAYQKAGVALPRERARDYAKRAKHIAVKDLQPGDLVFFTDIENGKIVIGHVGINIGGGRMVEASNPRSGVRISTFTGRSDIAYGGRL